MYDDEIIWAKKREVYEPGFERIAYIGNFRAPWCTEVHLAETLSLMGYKVDRIQEDEVSLKEIEKRGNASDLVLYTRTWGLPTGAIDVWNRLHSYGVPTASYHLDLYYGIKRQDTVHGDPFWSTKYVFTPDGDPVAQAWFESQGINHHWIKPGVFKPEVYRGRADEERFPHDIVFVGSWKNYHKEWPHRKRLVQHLMRKYQDRVGIYGHESLGTIRGWPLNDLYASAKVVVGDSLCPGFSKPNYWSDRVYETVGRGGCLIHPAVEGLQTDFEGAVDLLYYPYGDFDKVDELITHVLDNPDHAENMRVNGMHKVHKNFTYHNRLQQALAIIENGESS